MICRLPFESLQSFGDPHELIKDENGKEVPFGLYRFNQIIKECYLISKNINTSYNDLMDITPKEKDMMLEFLNDEAKKQEEMFEKQQAKLKKH